MKRPRNAAAQFIDMEARATSDEEDDDDDELVHGASIDPMSTHTAQSKLDGFFDDPDVGLRIPWRNTETIDTNTAMNDKDSWANLVDALEKRYGRTNALHRIKSAYRPLESRSGMASALERIIASPSPDDYPLWRLRCKVGFHWCFPLYLMFVVFSRSV